MVSVALHGAAVFLLMQSLVDVQDKGLRPGKGEDGNNVQIFWPGRPIPMEKGTEREGGHPGGGGARTKEAPTRGKLSPFAMIQIAPPIPLPRKESSVLEVPANLIGPPDLQFPSPNLPIFGDPRRRDVTGKSGPGGGDGIGNGCCGGVGGGRQGGGYGEEEGSRFGPRPPKPARAPLCLYCPDPQYTEEARRVKYEGNVMLEVLISAEGRAAAIHVIKGVGMGLDERAKEAVRRWRFQAAQGPDGKAVESVVTVEISFRLL